MYILSHVGEDMGLSYASVPRLICHMSCRFKASTANVEPDQTLELVSKKFGEKTGKI